MVAEHSGVAPFGEYLGSVEAHKIGGAEHSARTQPRTQPVGRNHLAHAKCNNATIDSHRHHTTPNFASIELSQARHKAQVPRRHRVA